MTFGMAGVIAVFVGVGAAAVGAALAMGRVGAATAEAIARQPEMKRAISMQTLATLAMIESLMVLVWLLALLLLERLR